MRKDVFPDDARRTPAQNRVVLNPPEPEVFHERPWQDDQLERDPIGDDLSRTIQGERSISISLHGEWGTGKTFFLQRWRQDLENSGRQAIYFNAWENDFADDPLAAVTSALAGQLKDGPFGRTAQDVAKKALQILALAAETALGASIGIRLPIRRLTAAITGFGPPSDPFAARKQALETLQHRLQQLSGKVREETGFPLVFIVDELDRCRPDFAVALLERVKHTLATDDVAFVFGVNRVSLGHTLSATYGIRDTDGYLRRFFDMELTIPPTSGIWLQRFASERAIQGHGLRATVDEIEASQTGRNWHHTMTAAQQKVAELCSEIGLTLRDVQHCERLLALAGRNLEWGANVSPQTLGIATVLKVTSPKLYGRLLQEKPVGTDVRNHFARMGHPNPDQIVRELGADGQKILPLHPATLIDLWGRTDWPEPDEPTQET